MSLKQRHQLASQAALYIYSTSLSFPELQEKVNQLTTDVAPFKRIGTLSFGKMEKETPPVKEMLKPEEPKEEYIVDNKINIIYTSHLESPHVPTNLLLDKVKSEIKIRVKDKLGLDIMWRKKYDAHMIKYSKNKTKPIALYINNYGIFNYDRGAKDIKYLMDDLDDSMLIVLLVKPALTTPEPLTAEDDNIKQLAKWTDASFFPFVNAWHHYQDAYYEGNFVGFPDDQYNRDAIDDIVKLISYKLKGKMDEATSKNTVLFRE